MQIDLFNPAKDFTELEATRAIEARAAKHMDEVIDEWLKKRNFKNTQSARKYVKDWLVNRELGNVNCYVTGDY